MEFLEKIALPFWPELKDAPLAKRLVGIGDVVTTLYSAPIFLGGLIWLISKSDFSLLQDEWQLSLLFIGIIALFSYLNFFMIIEFRQDRYGSADGSFNSMAVWAAAFIFGQTSLWLMLFFLVIQLTIGWPKLHNKTAKWDAIRNFVLSGTGFTVPYLIGLAVYEHLGGTYPIASLNYPDVLAGFAGIIVNFIAFVLIWLPYFSYAIYTQKQLANSENVQPIVRFFFLALALPTFAHPFSILAAGLFAENDIFTFSYFIIGLLVVAYITRQFSHIAESNRQQSRQLTKLEELGRAILTAPPDLSILPNILSQHVPNMFPAGSVAIWMIPGQILYSNPEKWDIQLGPIWDWGQNKTKSHAFTTTQQLPWSDDTDPHRPVVYTPIMMHDGNETIGGIYIELRQLAQPWDKASLQKLFPGLHTLSDQISSAIHQSEEYARSIALEKVSQEIQLAGQIQASFLPNQFPNIPGWQLAVTLEPAGGLSGDFFDLIPLSRGRLGIVIADVADKGLGAALYMALCRTLIRTYALEYHSRPDLVLSETNDRILADARANLFITCFYGVLDPNTDELVYCNAGHNPPFMLSTSNGININALGRTGMPIGIEEEASWARKRISFKAGDKLILYTDGVTEAESNDGEFFDEKNLLEIITREKSKNAFELQDEILTEIREFTINARQTDDITLMILEKEEKAETKDPEINTPAE